MSYRYNHPKLGPLLDDALHYGKLREYPQFKAEYLKTVFVKGVTHHQFRISGAINCKAVLYKEASGEYYFTKIGNYSDRVAGLVTTIRDQCIKALKQVSKQPHKPRIIKPYTKSTPTVSTSGVVAPICICSPTKTIYYLGVNRAEPLPCPHCTNLDQVESIVDIEYARSIIEQNGIEQGEIVNIPQERPHKEPLSVLDILS